MIPKRHSTWAISITPFEKGGSLDEPGLRAHCGRLASAGMGVYLGGSAPGQGNTLSLAELGRVFEIGRECFGGGVGVRAMGVEPRSAEQLIEIARLAKSTALDAVQVYSLDLGHGATPDGSELEGYFRTVLDQVEIPAVLSTHQCMGWFMPHEMMDALLLDYPMIGGIHVTNPDVRYLAGVIRVAESCAREVEVHTGLQIQALTALALGANGYLSGEANLFPELCLSLIECYDAGDLAGTMQAHRTLLELFPINLYGQGVRGLKAGMKRLGLPGHHHRSPVLPLSAEEEEEVAAVLHAQGLLPV